MIIHSNLPLDFIPAFIHKQKKKALISVFIATCQIPPLLMNVPKTKKR